MSILKPAPRSGDIRIERVPKPKPDPRLVAKGPSMPGGITKPVRRKTATLTASEKAFRRASGYKRKTAAPAKSGAGRKSPTAASDKKVLAKMEAQVKANQEEEVKKHRLQPMTDFAPDKRTVYRRL